MKITIDIPENEIMVEARGLVAEQIAVRMLGDYYHFSEQHCYKQIIEEIVREVIKGDKKNIEDRAIAAAAESIEKEAIKNLDVQENVKGEWIQIRGL